MTEENPFHSSKQSGSDVKIAESYEASIQLNSKPHLSSSIVNRTLNVDEAGSKSDENIPKHEKTSLDSIAKRLLEENYLLTALEFHAELVESGKDCKRLRSYFSNPANFEFRSTATGGSGVCKFEISPLSGHGLPRTSSAQTLDSLDYCQYSDDGKPYDERLAVLEFELRKSNETIKDLRSQLTLASEAALSSINESDSLTASKSIDDHLLSSVQHPIIKMHEKKALNFLINEYLLQNDYKLTGICFSDEVADQDFDHWDEVGLNIARPNDLLSIYRQSHHPIKNSIELEKRDFECQTDLQKIYNDLKGSRKHLIAEVDRLNAEIYRLNELFTNQHVPNFTTENRDQCKPSASSNDDIVDPCPSTSTRNFFPERKESKRLASFNVFRSTLMKMTAIKDTEMAISAEITTVVCSSGELIDHLCKSLPNMISSTPINKRLIFIRIILSLAATHTNLKERDRLLNSFFKLYKQPDEEQRHSMLKGCVNYVKKVGGLRTESEMLPQCWEQMIDKMDEKRFLVAEICGAIACHLPPELLGSLLLSILTQMLNDDKCETVRESVVKSLAIVCCYVEDVDKFSQFIELLIKAILDPSEQVSLATRLYFLPSLAAWSCEIGKFYVLTSSLVKATHAASIASNNNLAISENRLCVFIDSLKRLNPFLFRNVIFTGSFTPDANGDACDISDRFVPCENELESLFVLFDNDKKKLASLTSKYDGHTNKEWYTTWDSLEYAYKELLPQMCKIVGLIDCQSMSRCCLSMVAYFCNLAKMFGKGFTHTKINDCFVENFPLLKSIRTGARCDADQMQILARATVPVYVCSVLAMSLNENEKKAMRLFLKRCIILLSESEISDSAVLLSFDLLNQSCPDSDFCLSIVFELITYANSRVRRTCGAILCRLIVGFKDLGLKTRCLSALITLSSDPDLSVQKSSLHGFVALLNNETAMHTEPEILEKLRMQIGSFLDHSHADANKLDLAAHLIKVFAQFAATLQPAFRDEYLLSQLAVVAARNNLWPSQEQKQTVAAALFECYSSLSCCYISQSSVRDYFLPGLKTVLKDLDQERAQVAASIAKHLETKISFGGEASAQSQNRNAGSSILTGSSETVDVMKSRMFNKFRDFRDKMEQHKETVPKLFGSKK